MTRVPYETKGGYFSEDENLMQINEFLLKAAEACYAVGHNRKANGDDLNGQGFLAIGQMLEKTCSNVMALGTRKLIQ